MFSAGFTICQLCFFGLKLKVKESSLYPNQPILYHRKYQDLHCRRRDTSTDGRQQCNNADIAAGLRRALRRVRHGDLFSGSQAVE
jgi:hypothetical protein